MAVAIYSSSVYGSEVPEGTGQGLYFTGTARVVESFESALAEKIIGWARQRTQKANNKTAVDYLGHSPRRFYQFTPQQAWVTGERVLSSGQLVDTKVVLAQLGARV